MLLNETHRLSFIVEVVTDNDLFIHAVVLIKEIMLLLTCNMYL